MMTEDAEQDESGAIDSEQIELRRLNAAYRAVKKKNGSRKESSYRSDEYRELQNYRRSIKKDKNPKQKEKKSRKEKDARYYQKKKLKRETATFEKMEGNERQSLK